jgi:hypothetical protein
MQDKPRTIPRRLPNPLQQLLDQLFLRLQVGAGYQSLGALFVASALAWQREASATNRYQPRAGQWARLRERRRPSNLDRARAATPGHRHARASGGVAATIGLGRAVDPADAPCAHGSVRREGRAQRPGHRPLSRVARLQVSCPRLESCGYTHILHTYIYTHDNKVWTDN